MDKKRILTGDRPTGKLHIGHYFGSLKTRVEMQESGEYDPYILIADVQALTDNFNNPDKVRLNVFEITKDLLAIGIDPNKVHLFIQSKIPEIAKEEKVFIIGDFNSISSSEEYQKMTDNNLHHFYTMKYL